MPTEAPPGAPADLHGARASGPRNHKGSVFNGSDRWEQMFVLFDAALARPEAERAAFLAALSAKMRSCTRRCSRCSRRTARAMAFSPVKRAAVARDPSAKRHLRHRA